MSSYFLYVILLAICQVILFFGHNLGVNVIIFMVPLVLYLFKVLKDSNRVKNWYGFLLGIPIILLSLYYLLFNNNTFNVLNYITIILLLLLMYYTVVRDDNKIREFLKDSVRVFYKPLKYIGTFYRDVKEKVFPKFKRRSHRKGIWKTVIIVIPIVLIVLALLSKADETFALVFDDIFKYIAEIFKFEFLDKLLGKIFMFIIMCFVLGISVNYLSKDYGKDKYNIKTRRFSDIFTLKVLVIALNVIYVIFDIVQFKTVFLKGSYNGLGGVNYSLLARNGFFELMVVTFINMFIILLSKKFDTNEKDNRFMKIMNIIMIALTLVIIASSFIRMHMYEIAFGWTTLRLFVDIILITESLLMIPTVMYIINDKFNIVKSFVIIIVCVWTFTSFLNIDGIIANKNINRYYKGYELDIKYLETYTTDNTNALVDLYFKTNDKEIRSELRRYFSELYRLNLVDSWEEFNISKYKAIQLLSEHNLK